MYSRFVPNEANDAALTAAPRDPQFFQMGVMNPIVPAPPPVAIGSVNQFGYQIPSPALVQTTLPPIIPIIGQQIGAPPPGPPRFVLQIPADATALQRTWPMQPSTRSQVWTANTYGQPTLQ